MDKKMVFVIGVSVAAGYGLGEAELGPAKAAVPRRETGEVRLVLGAGAKATVESFTQSQICPLVDAKYDLTGALACAPDDLDSVTLFFGTDEEPGEITAVGNYNLEAAVTIGPVE